MCPDIFLSIHTTTPFLEDYEQAYIVHAGFLDISCVFFWTFSRCLHFNVFAVSLCVFVCLCLICVSLHCLVGRIPRLFYSLSAYHDWSVVKSRWRPKVCNTSQYLCARHCADFRLSLITWWRISPKTGVLKTACADGIDAAATTAPSVARSSW